MNTPSNAQSEQLINNEIHLAFGKICHAYGSILGGHNISGVNNDSHLRWLALAAIDLATAVQPSPAPIIHSQLF